MDKFKIISKERMEKLPQTTGVYSFIKNKEIIYIGKAINIKSRVKNHFNGKTLWEQTILRQGFGGQVGYLETNSEIEALILEANLIKKYQPKFNVMWRDDKNYFYVVIRQAQGKPYISITHQKTDEAEYIGPFTEGAALKKTLRFLRRVFPYYTSAKHPKTKCTWCHLDLCPGPNPNLSDYRKNIKKLVLILKGKRSSVLYSLEKEMKHLSKNKRFEEAAKIRDRIYNLQQVMSHTRVIEISNLKFQISNSRQTLARILGIKSARRVECYDVSNIQGKNATGSMAVFTDGKPDKNSYRKFKIKIEGKPNDIAMLKEIITRRLNHAEWPYPEAMLIDGGKAQLNVAINSKKNSNIKIMSIAKGRQELFIEGRENPIPLKTLPQEIQNLILLLDNEAHRFAISYHKKLRKRQLLQ